MLLALARHPVRELLWKWNYKSAITSSIVRGLLFLAVNLTAGWWSALASSAAEFSFRFATAGFYGALTQAFGRVRPAPVGTLAAMVCLPAVAHGLEFAVHALRGTPNLRWSIAASVVLTMGSTAFNVFAMRRGVFVVGVAGRQSLGRDLAALPALLSDFLLDSARTLRRSVSSTRIRRRWRMNAVALAALAGSWLVAGGSGAGATPDATSIRRFLSRDETVAISYVAERRIDVHNPRFDAQAWMEVVTTLDPITGLTWRVTAEGGSPYIRTRVIRKALETEAAAVSAGEPVRSVVSEANYHLVALDEGPDGTNRIQLVPRRRDRLLVDGVMLVGPDGDLLELRGRLARSPSWWTSWVEVVRHYGRVGGVRVALDTAVVSSVRMAGRSHLRVLYRYLELNGRRLEGADPRPPWPPPPWSAVAAPALTPGTGSPVPGTERTPSRR